LSKLRISVIIPVHNSAGHLRECLRSLSLSSVAPLECIVVDDCSTDDSAGVARQLGATVASTETRSGPARARNIGAKAARGEVLFFLDSDVCVRPDTLGRVAAAFSRDPDLDALIGSYDDAPGSEDFISQYKNLMHSFVHQRARQEACTFWSGCGAIRKAVFDEFGGFDESYNRPSIEDIELGYRLYEAGRKLALDREIRVKHLKHWTFWGLVKTDIFHRGIPWTELILRDRHMPNDLNVHLSQRVSVALMFLLSGMSLFAAVYWQGYFLVPLFAILFLVLGRYWVEFADYKERKAGMVWTSLIVAVIVITAYRHEMSVLIPPLLLGFVLLMVRHRYEYKSRGWVYISLLLVATLLALLVFTLFYIPFHRFVFSVIVVLLAVVLLNTQFYLFLAAKRGRSFALAAIPFHLLYHFYNGLSFVAGTIRYFWKTGRFFSSRKVKSPRGASGAGRAKGAHG
jgi:glycosyltransferase involved in cell wall biosynthesis